MTEWLGFRTCGLWTRKALRTFPGDPVSEWLKRVNPAIWRKRIERRNQVKCIFRLELAEVAFKETTADEFGEKDTEPLNKYEEREREREKERNLCKHFLTSKQQKQVYKIVISLSMCMCIFGDLLDSTIWTVFKQIQQFTWGRERETK